MQSFGEDSQGVTHANGESNRAVFVVDWDGTCVAEEWPGMGDWLPGAVDALRHLSSLGKTVIYSLRCHLYEIDDTTPRDPGQVAFEVARVRAKLDAAGLEHIDIYPPDRGKPPGRYYIDDRGLRFAGSWRPILQFIESAEAVRKAGEDE